MTEAETTLNANKPDDKVTSAAGPVSLAPPSAFRMPASHHRSLRNVGTPVQLTTPDVDQSFMRWSTASAVFSEADSSTWSFNINTSAPSLLAPRDSRVTNASTSNTSVSAISEFGSESGRRASFDTFGARHRPGSAPPVDAHGSGGSRSSRPMSMSSASGSLYRGALAELGKYEKTGESVVDINFAGPTLDHGTRRSPAGLKSDANPPCSAAPETTGGRIAADENCSTITTHVSGSSARRHRSTASVPPSDLSHIPQLSPVSDRAAIYSPKGRARSKSIDTVSLNQSMSDSVTGLLIPQDANVPTRLPLVHSHSLLPTELATTNSLNADQRAVLLRRAKKLEQLLGQSLDERSIERLLIDPIHATRTVTTHAAEEAWPSSPADGGSQAEWQRDDCIPRKGRQVNMPGLNRSRSVLAKRAKAALGLDSKAKNGVKGDLAVYVSREMRVSETSVRGVRPSVRHSLSSPPVTVLRHQVPITAPVSPRSILEDVSEDDVDRDEALRRTRRMQLAKLHRLLGVHIPLDVILRQGQETPERTSENDNSFMSFDETSGVDTPGWASRIKSTLANVRTSRDGVSSTPVMPSTPQEESFVDMGDLLMTDKEKALARKKAQKLEYMFGNAPPQNLYLPLRPATPLERNTSEETSIDRDRQSVHGSFEAYERSLKGLLYLVEHDPPSLDNLMDQLDETTHRNTLTRSKSISPQSPSTPFAADPDSHGARRKRTGKLSHFFGETGIDFDDPPNVKDTMYRVRTQHKRSSVRRETMDSMMREMWKGVQGEVKRGSMAVTDGEVLGEMIERLRRRRRSIGQWEVL